MSKLRAWLIHLLGGVTAEEASPFMPQRFWAEHRYYRDMRAADMGAQDAAKEAALGRLIHAVDELGLVKYDMSQDPDPNIDPDSPIKRFVMRAWMWTVKMPVAGGE